MRGATAYLVLLPFVSLPTLMFLAGYFLLPGGAATFLTGPLSYLLQRACVRVGEVTVKGHRATVVVYGVPDEVPPA